jgi:hypothetical protein
MADSYLQRNQPAGVPPLALTGERTLPDVPEENYWFRRHLAVYEWIAARAHGRRVVDLACGEGYGSAVLARIRELIGPDGVAYVSTPNVLTLAPEGAERSGNPWHVREYRVDEYRALCARHFGSVDLLGLFHARRLRAHQWAIEHAGWDAVHARLGLTRAFYDRFTPAISVRDFRLRRGGLDRALDFVAVLRP